MQRYSKLAFVVSLHLAVFGAGVYPPNAAAGLAFGGGGAPMLGGALFYEVAVRVSPGRGGGRGDRPPPPVRRPI